MIIKSFDLYIGLLFLVCYLMIIFVQVDIFQFKIDEIKKEYETKLDEYVRLLDIRVVRIKVCCVIRVVFCILLVIMIMNSINVLFEDV